MSGQICTGNLHPARSVSDKFADATATKIMNKGTFSHNRFHQHLVDFYGHHKVLMKFSQNTRNEQKEYIHYGFFLKENMAEIQN